MSESKTTSQTEEDIEELHDLLLEMGNGVDSLLSQAVVALLEGDSEMIRAARKEDVRAHNCWLKVDEHCRHMLRNDELEGPQVEKVTSALKMALDMRRIADEGCSAARAAEGVELETLHGTALRELIPHMAELAQDMLEKALDALTVRSSASPSEQRKTYRDLESESREVFTAVTESIQDGTVSPEQGGELLLVARTVERIGGYALDVSNHVGHYYETHAATPAAEEEA